jgi:short-subunit dehydrogenase
VLVAKVSNDHGACPYLINNADRSIRRGIINSLDRFHDFERKMQLNYFGALRLIIDFLPKMFEQKHGHIINISSIGVFSNVPRFSAYVASKSTLYPFAACAASEFLDKGINFTTINMPLVRTPMIDQDLRKRADAFARGGGRACLKAIVYKAVRTAT